MYYEFVLTVGNSNI